MLGRFAVCLANAVCIESLTPRSRVAAASCRTCRLCALCVSPFLSIRLALDSHASSPYRTPLPLSLFSWKHGRPHSYLVERTPSPLAYLLPAHVGSTPCLALSPQHDPSVYPIHVASTSSVLHPTSVHHYKMPLVLSLLLHPHFPRIRSRATISSRHCEARFVSLR